VKTENQLASNLNLIVYNNLGVIVSKLLINKTTSFINLSNLSSGIYYYKLNSSNNTLKIGTLIISL